MKQVVITIAPDGSSTVDSQGFTGNQCTLATRDIELALAGNGPVDDKKKPDFYATVGGTNKQTN